MNLDKRQPLHRLLLQLQAAGFKFSPADRLRLQQLVSAHVRELTTLEGQLAFKYKLAPIVAKTAHEQQQFYRIYDAYLAEIQIAEVPPKEQVGPLPPTESAVDNRWWRWVWLAAFLLLLTGIVAARWITVRADYEDRFRFQERNGKTQFTATDSIYLDNLTKEKHRTGVIFQWELQDEGGEPIQQITGENWTLRAPQEVYTATYLATMSARTSGGDNLDTDTLTILVNCFQAPAVRSIVPEPLTGDTLVPGVDILFTADVNNFGRDVTYRWDFGDGTLDTTITPTHQYQVGRTYTITLEVADRRDRTCSNRSSYTLDLQDEFPPLASPAFVRDQATQKFYAWGPYLLLFLLVCLTGWLWRYYVRRQQREAENRRLAVMQMGKQFNAPDKPPYQPPFKSRDDMVRREARQFAIANIFRQREKGRRRFLDLPRTIRQTAEAGGFPAFQYQYRSRPADYLFLIDEHNPKGHQVQLFRHLVQMLRQQDVYIDEFYYQDVPRFVWNNDFEEGISLDQLRRLFPDRRLVIFGDGHSWKDEMMPAGLAPDWQIALREWKSRLMVTPVPITSWTYREVTLYQLAALFPADMAHLLMAAEYIEAGMDEVTLPTTLRQWETQLRRNHFDVDINRKWRQHTDYQDYLRNHPEVFRWLQALIVHPEPNWNITISIGKALGVPVTYDNLLLLARIPWLNDRPLKVKLWRSFWEYLSPEDERKAREAIIRELETIAGDHPDSFANQQLQMELAIQRFALDPINPEHQRNIQFLEGEGYLDDRRLEELDLILKRQIDDLRATGLNPGDVLRLFLAENEEKPSWLSANLAWATLVTLVTLWVAGCLAGWFLTPQALPTIQGITGEKASALALLNNLAVDLYDPNGDGQLPGQYSTLRFEEADSLLNLALGIDSSYTPAKRNKAYIRYAQALTGYYTYHRNRLDTAVGRSTQRDFRRGLSYDSVLTRSLHGLGILYHYLGDQDSACLLRDQWQNRRLLDQELIYPNLNALAGYCDIVPPREVYVYFGNDWELPVADEIVTALRSQDILPVQELTDVIGQNSSVSYQDPEEEGLARVILQLAQKALKTEGFAADNRIELVPPPNKIRAQGDVQVFLKLPQPEQPLVLNGRVTTSGLQTVGKTTQIIIRPIPDAQVQISINDRGLTRRTGTDGTFSFRAPPADIGQPLRVRVNVEGYELFDERYTVGEGLELNVELQPIPGTEPQKPIAEVTFPALPPEPYACRVLEMAGNVRLAFRNRPLARTELDALNAGDREALNRETLVSEINVGDQLELIDSSEHLYRVRYQGTVGYIAKNYQGNSTLSDCGGDDPTQPDAIKVPVPDMVRIPGGTFIMGCADGQTGCFDDEYPARTVEVSTYRMSKFEIINLEFVTFLNAMVDDLEIVGEVVRLRGNIIIQLPEVGKIVHDGASFYIDQGFSLHPTNYVSWFGAIEYCNWLSIQHKRKPVYTVLSSAARINLEANGYRLPSEAEWEYAAKGGNVSLGFTYAGSNDPDSVGWYEDNSSGGTHPVGAKVSNELGLFDMSGNVWEWANDCWQSNYQGASSDQSPRLVEGDCLERVVRGGGWSYTKAAIRAQYRGRWSMETCDIVLGFRLCSNL